MEIQIRSWQQEDAAAIANALNNKNVQDNLRDGMPFPYTEEDAKEYLSIVQKAEPDTEYNWAILADDEVVGSVGVFRQNNIHKYTAEMGYYIAEAYWGKGIGTKALHDVCACIFEKTNIVRIYAQPFSDNIGSCRILEKSGFICEGILRKNAVKNGQLRDMKLYARLKDET